METSNAADKPNRSETLSRSLRLIGDKTDRHAKLLQLFYCLKRSLYGLKTSGRSFSQNSIDVKQDTFDDFALKSHVHKFETRACFACLTHGCLCFNIGRFASSRNLSSHHKTRVVLLISLWLTNMSIMILQYIIVYK